LEYFKYITITLLFAVFLTSYGQEKPSFGLSATYNFPLKTSGVGFRGNIPIIEKLMVVPQVKFMPSYNSVNELYAGLNLHYVLAQSAIVKKNIQRKNPTLAQVYLAAGIQYNRWINYVPTLNDRAKAENFLPETGIGVNIGKKRWKAFAELKYNIFWKESYTEIGVLINPFIKRNKTTDCPKI
jgi:hypothetical protein